MRDFFPFDCGLTSFVKLLEHPLMCRLYSGLFFMEVAVEMPCATKVKPAIPESLVRETSSCRPIRRGTSKGAYIHQNLFNPSAWMPARVR